MRKLAVLTTTAAVAMFGVAQAQPAPRTTAHRTTAAATTPAAPPVAMAPAAPEGSMQAALMAYAAYHADVSDLRAARINTADDLETALDRAGRHNRDDMTRGWVAYGALTAAQSPAFMQGVRDAAAYYGRDAVVWAITVDPYYARGLRGGAEATKLMLDSAAADAARIISVADRYQEMSYGLQRQRWANAVAPQQRERLQRVRSLGTQGNALNLVAATTSPRLAVTPLSIQPQSDPTAFGGRRFWDAVSGGNDVVQVAAQVSYQWRANDTRAEALDRMASIAALHALGAVEDHQSAINALMNDPRSKDCLEMAQLQLYQCMSAAHFRYENAFCLGQHGLRDIGTCIGTVGVPDTTAMTPVSSGRGGRD